MRSLLAVISAVGLLCFSYGCASETSDSDPTTPAETAPASASPYSAPLPSSTPSVEETGSAPVTASADTSDGEEPNAASDDDDAPAAPIAPSAAAPSAPAPAAPSVVAKPADPGPAPSNACSVSKDAQGFFKRNSGKSDYVAYVPASYSSSKPMRVIVGMHGCSDTADNFARWGVNPWDLRAKQDWIGISVGGESGNNKCWSMGTDDAKVLAAVDDIAKCFWVDRSRVVVGGFSSGGQLAYRVGLKHADRFAGILIENSGLYAAGDAPANLVNNASWDIPIAHVAHTGDGVFPIAKVRADWSVIKAGGLPLTTRELSGGHNGDGKDWATILIPTSAGWTKR